MERNPPIQVRLSLEGCRVIGNRGVALCIKQKLTPLFPTYPIPPTQGHSRPRGGSQAWEPPTQENTISSKYPSPLPSRALQAIFGSMVSQDPSGRAPYPLPQPSLCFSFLFGLDKQAALQSRLSKLR